MPSWNSLLNICIALMLMLVIVPGFVATVPDSDFGSPDTKVNPQHGVMFTNNEDFDVILDDTSYSQNNSTTSSNTVGFIAAGIAVLFFGSNLVPVKKANTGDGMFYQWVDCISIWYVGLIVNLIRDNPPFHPLAMLGGFLWTTGNITVVPIIKTLGLSLGILIWGSVNLLTGWASGRFGFFGINKDVIHNSVFNYIGVALALLSAILYILVKSEVSKVESTHSQCTDDQASLINNTTVMDVGEGPMQQCVSPTNQQHDETKPLLSDVTRKSEVSNGNNLEETSTDASWVDKLSPLQKRIVGIVLSVFAGCLYGFNFVPCIWIQDNVEGASQNGLDYVFAHFCGISLTSSVYFLLYCIYKRNRPQVGVGLIIPSVISGVMWAIAQTGWFVANFNLTESVSFPIITTGPGIIASLWGVFAFKEIQGIRNYIVLGLAFAITITGAIFTAFSK